MLEDPVHTWLQFTCKCMDSGAGGEVQGGARTPSWNFGAHTPSWECGIFYFFVFYIL